MKRIEILQCVKDNKPEYKSFAIYDKTETAKNLISLIKGWFILVKSGLSWTGGRNQWSEDCWLTLTTKGEKCLEANKQKLKS